VGKEAGINILFPDYKEDTAKLHQFSWTRGFRCLNLARLAMFFFDDYADSFPLAVS
jgi:hypothetical protein